MIKELKNIENYIILYRLQKFPKMEVRKWPVKIFQ